MLPFGAVSNCCKLKIKRMRPKFKVFFTYLCLRRLHPINNIIKHQAVNQLLCNQTCWLYFMFVQHCCNWTLDNLFMWHHHTQTVDCVCAFLYNQAFYQVCTLSCDWTVNIWSNSCNIIAIALHNHLSLQHHCSWTVHVYDVLWSHNNCLLRSCFHNYHFVYCCYGFTIVNESWCWTQYFWVHNSEKKDYHPSHPFNF